MAYAYLTKRGPVQVHICLGHEGIRHERRDGEREVRGHVGRRDGQRQRCPRSEFIGTSSIFHAFI